MKSSAIVGSIGLFFLLATAHAQAQPLQVCDLQEEGEGAQWLAPCERAALRGNGHAALMVGAIYWNGDGVAKDHAAAARWFELADLAGETRAAKMLGDEAFGRLVKTANPDRAVLDTAIGWYEKALEVEPVPAAKAEAQQSLAMLSSLKQKLLAR
ncbi:MAG: sel1 repeat family protein [Rhizobiales bacterium]|nr:sel1 repeat family protein [Hyphomicrobiales bacterium]